MDPLDPPGPGKSLTVVARMKSRAGRCGMARAITGKKGGSQEQEGDLRRSILRSTAKEARE